MRVPVAVQSKKQGQKGKIEFDQHIDRNGLVRHGPGPEPSGFLRLAWNQCERVDNRCEDVPPTTAVFLARPSQSKGFLFCVYLAWPTISEFMAGRRV